MSWRTIKEEFTFIEVISVVSIVKNYEIDVLISNLSQISSMEVLVAQSWSLLSLEPGN